MIGLTARADSWNNNLPKATFSADSGFFGSWGMLAKSSLSGSRKSPTLGPWMPTNGNREGIVQFSGMFILRTG
ncbi:MAG: hypothetical protein IPJ06_10775 [Saprospiraceae bacterium]|nr:hypothetical protein [Saprospiraceae bacterium]